MTTCQLPETVDHSSDLQLASDGSPLDDRWLYGSHFRDVEYGGNCLEQEYISPDDGGMNQLQVLDPGPSPTETSDRKSERMKPGDVVRVLICLLVWGWAGRWRQCSGD